MCSYLPAEWEEEHRLKDLVSGYSLIRTSILLRATHTSSFTT